MDKALLVEENEERREGRRCKDYMEEMKKVNNIAIPMIVVTLAQYMLRVSPLFMLGHLGQLSLSSASIATSLSNVTGFSVLFGMSSALETLCGQAYGAKMYQRLGTYTYGAIACLFIVCLPVSLIWIFTDKLLILTGQDPLIATEAGKYCIWLIPTLFPYAILQSLVRFLQSQSLILPMLVTSVAALFFQLLLCWTFIFRLDLGNAGAALSIGIAYWLNVVLLVLYISYSSTCKDTRATLSMNIFSTMGEFFKFAIPSATMVCLEWWSFELVILLSGLLPNPALETSVLSIGFTVTSLHYHIPYSFGAAASTRVSNELGAGNPQMARLAVSAVLILAVGEFALASITMFACRSTLGYAFSYEKEVVDYVKKMTPLLWLSIVMDSLQAVLSGVVRGSGWQHLGAYINLGAYYLLGIPVALVMGFVWHLKGMGLWSGLVVGSTVQCVLFSLLTILTNWEQEAIKARHRILDGGGEYPSLH